MEPDQIRDRRTLERWLKARPEATRHSDAIVIAFRAAGRVMPVYGREMGQDWAHKHDFSALPVLRCLLTAGVAREYPTPEVKAAAAAAARSTAARYEDARYEDARHADARYAAADARYAAADAAAANDPNAARAAAYAAAAATAADAWKQIRNDCRALAQRQDPDALPLWQGAPNPLAAAWAETEALWQQAAPDYDFWRRWYQSLLTATSLPPELLRDIALIPDEDWKQGPAHVAGRIKLLENKRLFDTVIRDNPYALTITFDAQTAKLASQPAEAIDLGQIVKAVSRVLDDFKRRCKADTSPNCLGSSIRNAVEPVLKDIRRDMKRFAAEPLFLFDALTDARVELGSIQRNEGFAGVALFDRLLVGIERYSDDICAASPLVLATERNRAAVQLERFTQNQLALAVEVSRGMQGDSKIVSLGVV